MPVDSPAGGLLLRAEPDGPSTTTRPPATHKLFAAILTGSWTSIGAVTVDWGRDEDIHFDAVQHPVPGCAQYPAVRVVREPSYAAARLFGRP